MITETIADFPAYRIYKAYQGRKFKHGDVIAIPFVSKFRGDTIWHMFTLGTVAGYAIERGEDYFIGFNRVSFSEGFNESFMFEGTIAQFIDCFGGSPDYTFEDCVVVAKASGMILFKKVD